MVKRNECCFYHMVGKGEIEAIVDQQGLKKMGKDGYFGQSASMDPSKTVPPIGPRHPAYRKYDAEQ
jgi:hypothetical protein